MAQKNTMITIETALLKDKWGRWDFCSYGSNIWNIIFLRSFLLRAFDRLLVMLHWTWRNDFPGRRELGQESRGRETFMQVCEPGNCSKNHCKNSLLPVWISEVLSVPGNGLGVYQHFLFTGLPLPRILTLPSTWNHNREPCVLQVWMLLEQGDHQ